MFLKENLLFDILGVKVNSLMSCDNQGDIDLSCDNQGDIDLSCDNQGDIDLSCDNQGDIDLSCDNQGDIDLSKNPTKHSKAKHIEIK